MNSKCVPVSVLAAKLKTMPREELEKFAADVTFVLYGTFYADPDLIDADADKFPADAKDGEEFLDQDTEWTGDNIESIAEIVCNAGLNPDELVNSP